MKKTIALLLALIMVFALVSCGSKTKTAESGKLTMATNAQFPPYEYYEGEAIVGIDAEIAGAIAKKLGLELVIEDMEFDSIIEAVKSGKADIGMAGMTVTPEREEVVNFTASYATGRQVVIVTEDSAITSVDDLFADGANFVIGVKLDVVDRVPLPEMGPFYKLLPVFALKVKAAGQEIKAVSRNHGTEEAEILVFYVEVYHN